MEEEQITEIIKYQKTPVDIPGLMEQTWKILKKVLYVLSYSYIVCVLVLVCVMILQHTGHLSADMLAKFSYLFNQSGFFTGVNLNSNEPDYFVWCCIIIIAWIAVGTRVMGKEILGGLLGIFLIASLFIPYLFLVWVILGLLLLLAMIIALVCCFIKGNNTNNLSGFIAYLVLGVRAVIYVLTGKQ